jgi:hypothetical protein
MPTARSLKDPHPHCFTLSKPTAPNPAPTATFHAQQHVYFSQSFLQQAFINLSTSPKRSLDL